jgi:hypothetical protein
MVLGIERRPMNRIIGATHRMIRLLRWHYTSASLVKGRLAALKVKNPGPTKSPSVCAAGTCGDPDVVCFVAGTKVKTNKGYVDIESLVIGDRVLTDAECSGTAVDEASWAAITLAMPNPARERDVIDIRVLRPLSWLTEQRAVHGSLLEMHLEELQLSGPARVVAIDRVPPLAAGPGCLVLSTVTHLNGSILEISFEDSETVLQPTARHHLHSYDTQDWVAASNLRPGDRLTTSDGHVTVSSVVPRPGTHRVFNIEVETRHAYYVSSLDVFSHNTGACGPASGRGPDTAQAHGGTTPGHPVPQVGHATPWAEMSESQRKAFQHSYSRHGEELGLPSWSQKKAADLQHRFNSVVGYIREHGRLITGLRKPFNSESVEVRFWEAELHGRRYYYYETLSGQFISAGLAR